MAEDTRTDFAKREDAIDQLVEEGRAFRIAGDPVRRDGFTFAVVLEGKIEKLPNLGVLRELDSDRELAQADLHRVELLFEGGVMTAKLICPPCGCSEHEGHCPVRDWFDNVCAEELMEGTVRFPVAVEWPGEDEGPTLKVVPPNYEVVKEDAA